MSIDELFEVDEQILLAEDRIAKQKMRVVALELEGRDASVARDKLLFVENALSLLVSRRNMLMREA